MRRLTILLSVLALGLAACGPPPADDGWELNDHVEQRTLGLACPNGGKVSPKTPAFGKSIDGHASYVGQSKCAPTARPGVVAFKNLVLATYPCTHSGGITRSCSVGGKSEHKEGRAWDWMIKYPHPAADALLKWLLATDKHGNKHANARRLGIMYMVWNRKIWGSYSASQGWRKYTGSNPHTDHVHFSFSWAGANKQTSFWKTPMPPANQPPQGWLDSASCTQVRGWAQDPDAKSAAINVHVYFDGTPGQKGAKSYSVKADQHRADLCKAIGSCKHGFVFKTPSSFHDGKPHKVWAYGIDTKGGTNPALKGGPKTITCSPPKPTPKPPAPRPDLSPPATDAGAPDAGQYSLRDDLSRHAMDGALAGADQGALLPATAGRQHLRGGCAVGAGEGAPWVGLLLVLAGLLLRGRRSAVVL